jgi:hypothetical protein
MFTHAYAVQRFPHGIRDEHLGRSVGPRVEFEPACFTLALSRTAIESARWKWNRTGSDPLGSKTIVPSWCKRKLPSSLPPASWSIRFVEASDSATSRLTWTIPPSSLTTARPARAGMGCSSGGIASGEVKASVSTAPKIAIPNGLTMAVMTD